MKNIYINIATYFPFISSFLVSLFLLLKIRKEAKEKVISEKHAKNKYSLYVLIFGTSLFGFLLSFGLISFFNLSGGHGYFLIEMPILHVLFSGILIILGRIVIGWKQIRY